MKIAIAILNWNGAELLKRYLPSVIEHSTEADVYVIDNASTDSSIALLKTSYPTVRLIELPQNFGYAGGYNKGLKQIEADVFCLLNSDVEVTKNWLRPIIDLYATNKEVAIVQPKILDATHRDRFEYAGAAGGYLDMLGYPFCRGRIFQHVERDEGQYDDKVDIFWASGACFFIKSHLFWKLGAFDTDYFAHQEEIDLCWRANNAGKSVVYIGKSCVYHLGGGTLKEASPQKTYLNFRNSLFSILKNVPIGRALFIIWLRLLLDGLAALRFAAQGKLRHVVAVLHAHISFYGSFRSMYGKRETTNFILKYYLVKSIVWSHFVHQVNNFNNLVKD